jgi:hypothetical protein
MIITSETNIGLSRGIQGKAPATPRDAQRDVATTDLIQLDDKKSTQLDNSQFYTYEEAPWQAKGMSKETYIENLRADGVSSLNNVYAEYSSFKQDLAYTNPELANKYFGFSLRADLSIAVTDPDNVLTDAELGFLSEKMNQLDTLKEHMRTHARAVLELVDHDDMFEGRYSLTLDSFQSVIDYAAIFCRNPTNSFTDAWIDQVERNASQRERSRVNTKV